jgi:translation elongation factor EF-1alpha
MGQCPETLTGKVLKYYSAIGVASVELSSRLKVGDSIHIKGHVTDFDQTVRSMQMQHRDITEARPGDIVGIKVDHYVRKNDRILVISDKK